MNCIDTFGFLIIVHGFIMLQITDGFIFVCLGVLFALYQTLILESCILGGMVLVVEIEA